MLLTCILKNLTNPSLKIVLPKHHISIYKTSKSCKHEISDTSKGCLLVSRIHKFLHLLGMLSMLFLSSLRHLRYAESVTVVYKTFKHRSLFDIWYLLCVYLTHNENHFIEYFTNVALYYSCWKIFITYAWCSIYLSCLFINLRIKIALFDERILSCFPYLFSESNP